MDFEVNSLSSSYIFCIHHILNKKLEHNENIDEKLGTCIIACFLNGREISSLIIEGETWGEVVCE
jgi:hypothetical protein